MISQIVFLCSTRYKHDGELSEISNEFQYKKSKEELEDGIRLVLWAKAS